MKESASSTTDLVTYINDQLQQRDWSQNRLAREAKLSPSQVSRVMNGVRPSPEIAGALGKALGLSAESVLKLAGRLEPDVQVVPKDMTEWREIFMQAKPAQREQLLKLARELVKVLT